MTALDEQQVLAESAEAREKEKACVRWIDRGRNVLMYYVRKRRKAVSRWNDDDFDEDDYDVEWNT